jgi:hypothetical protein
MRIIFLNSSSSSSEYRVFSAIAFFLSGKGMENLLKQKLEKISDSFFYDDTAQWRNGTRAQRAQRRNGTTSHIFAPLPPFLRQAQKGGSFLVVYKSELLKQRDFLPPLGEMPEGQRGCSIEQEVKLVLLREKNPLALRALPPEGGEIWLF